MEFSKMEFDINDLLHDKSKLDQFTAYIDAIVLLSKDIERLSQDIKDKKQQIKDEYEDMVDNFKIDKSVITEIIKGKMNEDKLIQNIKKYELVSEIFEVINKE